jgi:hypothetical protein
LAAWIGLAGSAAALSPELADTRYAESGFGLSFAEPRAAELNTQPNDGSVVAWELGERASLRLRIKRSRQVVGSLDPFIEAMWKDSTFGLTGVQPQRLRTEHLRLADRPAVKHFAELQPSPPLYLPPHERAKYDTRPLAYHAALIKLDPFSVAILEVYAPLEDDAAAETLLDRVAASAELAEPTSLYEVRKQQLNLAKQWLAGIDFQAAAEQQPTDAWFEIRHESAVIGYGRMRVRTDPEALRQLKVSLGRPGFAVGRYTCVRRGQSELITRDDLYRTETGTQEVWSKVSTLSSTQRDGGGIFEDQRVSTDWAETGVRNDRSITLAFKVPPDADAVRNVLKSERALARLGLGEVVDEELLFSRRETYVDIPERLPRSRIDNEVPVPPADVYLSQALLPLLPTLLPKAEPAEFGFYAYDSDAGTLALRTYRVRAAPRGGTTVDERPTPWSPWTTHRFDAQGALVEIVRPGGTRWVPSTKARLSQAFPELR